MSFGEFLFVALLIAPFVFTVAGLAVFSLLCLIRAEKREQLLMALVAMAILGYLAWLVMDFPGLHEQQVPHAVEGREEWIDLREGTNYSQKERRTDA